MKQYEIIKSDGEIEVKERVASDNKRYYLKGNETFLESFIDFNNIDKKANYNCIRSTSILFDVLKTRNTYSHILSTSFNKIKDISSENDIKDLITYLTMEYEKTFRLAKSNDDFFIGRRNVLNDSLKENKDTVYFLVLKKTLDEYFNNITSLSDLGMLEVLLDLVREDKIDEVLQLLHISLDGFNDDNLKNLSYKLVVNNIAKNKQAMEKHLCSMNCGNLSHLNCPKIFDIQKKNIEDYTFIKSGYQTVHEDEEGRLFLDSFVVTDCDYYYEVKDTKRLGKKHNKKS